jgi:Rhodopirellula transposase DDE domain
VYDVGANAGWVSVGTDRDTAAFAAGTIRAWWNKVGAVADLPVGTQAGQQEDGSWRRFYVEPESDEE